MNPIFETLPMRIGKHEWRLIVRPSQFGRFCTDYQWRRIGGSQWKPMRDWPSYNFNDGMYAGCPKSLVQLYRQHEQEVKAALAGQPQPQEKLAI